MSIPIRLDNGRRGRYAVNGIGYREESFRINLSSSFNYSMITDAYKKYMLNLSLSIFSPVETKADAQCGFDTIYEFLYGMKIGDLVNPVPIVNPGILSPEEKFKNYIMGGQGFTFREPITWDADRVKEMNWDSFVYSFYACLCSDNTYSDRAWQVMLRIVSIIKNQGESIWNSNSFGQVQGSQSLSDFKETVSRALYIKAKEFFKEEACYSAYKALLQVKDSINDDYYTKAEYECVSLLTEIAKNRTMEVLLKTSSEDNILNIDPEDYFFFEDYFTLHSADKKIKVFLYSSMHQMLTLNCARNFKNRNYYLAGTTCSRLLKYSITVEQREDAITKAITIGKYLEKKRKTVSSAILMYEEIIWTTEDDNVKALFRELISRLKK